MSRAQKSANLGAVVVPFVAFLSALVLLWNHAVDVTDLAILAVMYPIAGFGVTIGYHRLLTHRSFATPAWLGYVLATMGTMAVQGPVIAWVADHRKHHAHTDEEGDPHSPHVGHGSGLRGLWYAHVGWLMDRQGQAGWRKYAPDLLDDPGMRRISRSFGPIILAGLAIPTVAGFALHGFTWQGALRGLLWGGLVRVFLLHHVTWSINSVCHFTGARRFATDDHSTNVFWLALPSLGEAWHHNHHAFPRSARHGLRAWELDPSDWVIRGLERVGLAHDVVRITPERQRQRLAAGVDVASQA